MKHKTAKDIAFDKERARLNKQIRELESLLRTEQSEIIFLREQNKQLSSERDSLNDWVRRLLEYMDLSEDEMRKIICKEKKEIEFFEHITEMNRAFSRMGSRSFFDW